MQLFACVFIVVCTFFRETYSEHEKPNIIIIMADDMGWNDVSFHGSNEIPTPNIDALAYNGVVFNRFYTQHICTPSRVALLTGNYPFRTGYQGYPIRAGENKSLPESVHLLPKVFQQIGYSTYLIGKWHLGHEYKNSTPNGHGFNYHYGYWNGYIGYYDKSIVQNVIKGIDWHENFEQLEVSNDEYVTDLFTKKTIDIIRRHKYEKKMSPFFILLSHLAPHAGKGGIYLEVKNLTETNSKFSYIEDENRRLYAGLMSSLDESVGEIIETLSSLSMLNNTIVMFLSDNGAQSIGLHQNFGSNWPLRGVKFTIHEGGVRGTAVMYYNNIKRQINNDLTHLVDLLPTFYGATGASLDDLNIKDGKNLWHTLIENNVNEAEYRQELLINIDEKINVSAIIGVNGTYKLIKGSAHEDYENYYGPNNRNPNYPIYDINQVLNSKTNLAIRQLQPDSDKLDQSKIEEIRRMLDINTVCNKTQDQTIQNCKNVCLFHIIDDPCEKNDIAESNQGIVKALEERIQFYGTELVRQPFSTVDLAADPQNCKGYWYNWKEKQQEQCI